MPARAKSATVSYVWREQSRVAQSGGRDSRRQTAEEIEEEVRRHLEPLGLAPEGTPVGELVRLAVAEIIKK